MSVASAVSGVARRRPVLVSRRARTTSFAVAVAAVALVAGVTSEAAPTGVSGADFFWSALLGGLSAYLAGTARRWTWFVPAGLAGALGGNGVALACAGAAIAVGLWSVLTETRSRARGAVVGGLGCVALLHLDPIAFHGFTAILTPLALGPLAVSGYQNAGRRAQSRLRKLVALAGGVVVLMLAGVALGIVSVGRDLTRGAHLIDEGLVAARSADDDLAGERLQQAARHLTSADATLTSWFVSPARVLPIVGPNLDAVESLASETGRVAEVSAAAANLADVDQLRFVDGRLDPQAVARMEQPLSETVHALDGLQTTVDGVNSPWLVAPMSDRLHRLHLQLDDAMPDADLALATVKLAPDMLGASGPRRYLVLFVTPVEARGRTGFPGNYAELVLDNGKMSMPRFGRISELEQGGTPGPMRRLTQPPDYVARYSRFDIATTWRNLTMGADFPEVATAVRELYPQSGGAPIDGVLAIDPVGLAALLRYTGPVDIPGYPQPLTEDNAAQFLELDQYTRFTDVSERIDVLDTVAHTTFDRLTSADLPSPSKVSEQLDPVADGGHIQFFAFNAPEALYFQTLGLSGRLGEARPGRDSVAVTSSNAGASKIDLFLERRTNYDVTWNPDDGSVRGTITTTLHNTAPASGLPDYVIGNTLGLPQGTNKSFVSIYTLFNATQARVDGQPIPVQSEQEAQHNVYSTFVTIPPGGTVTVELDVSGHLQGNRFRVDLNEQPLVIPEQAEVTMTVAGDHRLRASRGVELHDQTAHWSGALDQARSLTVAAAG
jgi:hypothetical protein